MKREPKPGAAAPERWVLRPLVPAPGIHGDRREPLVRLVCVPYAGGSAAVYHQWAHSLPSAIEPWALRLPGHDSRMDEPLCTDLISVAREAAAALAGLLPGPYALFGHSLGALLAFEIAHSLRDVWGIDPVLLAVSARDAPQLSRQGGTMHRLPDEEYLETLDRRFGAIPPVIREDPQMRALYLPILRADTTMLETYRHQEGRLLDCPILAFGGADDPETSADALSAWSKQTTAGCSTTLFPGGHFFLQPERDRLLRLLSDELLVSLVP